MKKMPVQLTELTTHVQTSWPDSGPLDRLEEVCSTAAALDELADHLIGHFVDCARSAGASWTQIGERIGVSKQAARKRFLPGDIELDPSTVTEKVFGRYTPRARHAIVLAQNNARHHHHHYIGTEHILLGLCQERPSLAVSAIQAAGIDPDDLEGAIIRRLLPASDTVPDKPPFTGKAKKALELTVREALRLGHNHVGTEHLRLGLQAEQTGLAAQVLTEQGLSPE
ncbi:MAG: Clp protease N-terminal domain-containing protein [Pseudonocardiaceae bacterium]